MNLEIIVKQKQLSKLDEVIASHPLLHMKTPWDNEGNVAFTLSAQSASDIERLFKIVHQMGASGIPLEFAKI